MGATAGAQRRGMRARGLEHREVLGGVIGGPGQRTGGDEEEAFLFAQALIVAELVRGDEAVDGRMLAGRLEILADGEEIDAGGSEIVHQRRDLVRRLAQTHHDAGLGEDARIAPLGVLQQRQRMGIVGSRPDAPVKRRHRLHIVIEHVGLRRDDDFQCAGFSQEVGGEHLDRRAGGPCPDGCDRLGEMRGAAVLEIVAVDRGDDNMIEGERGDGRTDAGRLAASSAAGFPVATLQKAQARVQVSPMIITVAWRFSQHSPILGQAASSHTVCRRCSRMMARVASNA
ncbi:hypothetical protein AUC69_14435 [Methyloceanibacter superfactus]|uniref:Uncharacterized protein n=1 Tax=Methyloceanibacter superfactus TaxID=1774969 RepID=A0A1E3VS73_9HYPH|nr:hypothetical protein AUC69_14435 [Methyloceanibacter superfactus]